MAATMHDIIDKQLRANLPRLPAEVSIEVARDIESALRLAGAIIPNAVTRMYPPQICDTCGAPLRPKTADPRLYSSDTKPYGIKNKCIYCYRKYRRANGPTGNPRAGHPRARLTPEDVLAIREKHAAGGISQRQLAAMFDIGQSQIHAIIHRKHWAHI